MEEKQWKNRLLELARRSSSQNIYTYTEFCAMNEVSLAQQWQKEFVGTVVRVFGGSEVCERQMIRFGSEETLGYEEAFPIACLHITPANEKFGEELGHRDILGAVMNLGLERDVIGDILIRGKEAWLFCKEDIADYLIRELIKIRHTTIRIKRTEAFDQVCRVELKEEVFTASSNRIDGVIAKLCKLSRSQSQTLFAQKKVFVNASVCENNAYFLKENDTVAVRGFGKFIFREIIGDTKKGKLRICCERYV